MKMISAWGEGDYRIGLFWHDNEDRFALTTQPFKEAMDEMVAVNRADFSEFLDCVLEGAGHIAVKISNGEVISAIMETDEGFVSVGWGYRDGQLSYLYMDQNDSRLVIPRDYLDDSLSWIMREFYLLDINDIVE